jgi:hypothetical protein
MTTGKTDRKKMIRSEWIFFFPLIIKKGKSKTIKINK